MATRLYLPVSGSAIGLAPLPSLAPDANWELRDYLIRNPTSTAPSGSSLQTFIRTWPTGTTVQWVWGQWQTESLQNIYYWSGTAVSMVVGKCAETTNSGDSHLAYSIRIVDVSGTSVRGTLGLYHATSSEFPLVASAASRIHNARVAGGSSPFISYPGDRIIIELGLHGVTPALEAIRMNFGDPTGTAQFTLLAGDTNDKVPWVELPQNVTFAPLAPITINLDTAQLTASGDQIQITPLALRTDGARLFQGGAGTGDKILFSNHWNPKGSPLTVSAWVNVDSQSLQNQSIWATHRGDDAAIGAEFGIQYTFVGSLYNQLYIVFDRQTLDFDGVSNEQLTSGTWNHVLVTHDGSLTKAGVQFYFNGRTGTNGTFNVGSGAEIDHTGTVSIGGRVYSNSFEFDGRIGEVAVWDRVLSSDEIAYLSNWGTLPSAGNVYDGLKFLFHPDEPKDLINDETGIPSGTSLALGPDLTMNTITYLQTAQLVAQGQTGTITNVAGGTTIDLGVAQLIANGQTLTVSAPPAEININLNAASLSATGRSITPQPGEVSKSLNVAQLTANGQQLTIQEGAVSINLSRAQLVASGQQLTVQPGAISKSLNTALLTANGRALTVQPGEVSKSLSTAQLVATGRALVVQPGSVTKSLQVGQLTATGQQLSVSSTVTINLSRAQLTATGRTVSVSQMDLCADEARDFNGSSDRIDWTSPLNTKNQPLTVSAWLNLDSLKSNQYIWASHQSGTSTFGKVFNIVQGAGHYLNFVIQRTSQNSWGGDPGVIPTGTWGHVLVTHNGTGYGVNDVTFYFNGITGSTRLILSGSGAEGNQTGSWSVGGRIYDNTRNIDAKIGEVAVWNRVLSQSEITELASRSTLKSATNFYTDLVFCSYPGTLENLVDHSIGVATGTTVQVGPCLTYNTVIWLSKATLTASGQQLTVSAPAPGDININLNKASLTASGGSITPQPGAVSKDLSVGQLNAIGRSILVQPGEVTKNLNAALLTATGRQLTVSSIVTINLNRAQLTASGQQLTVSAPPPGDININLSKASLVATGRTITPQPGAISKNLGVGQLIAAGRTITVQPGLVTKNLNVALLTAAGRQLIVQAGAVTKNLNAAQLVATGRNITVSASGSPVTINLNCAQLTANGRSITPQPGAVSKSLQRATLTASGQQLTVQEGEVTIALDPALLTANGRTITPQPGTVTITFSRAQLTANGQTITITVPFPQTINLSRAQLIANGQHLSVNPVVPVVSVPSGGGGGIRRRRTIIVNIPEDIKKKKIKMEDELLIVQEKNY